MDEPEEGARSSLEEARSDPNSREFLPHSGGRSRSGSKGTKSATGECDVWHHREQLQAPECSQVPRVPIHVLIAQRYVPGQTLPFSAPFDALFADAPAPSQVLKVFNQTLQR